MTMMKIRVVFILRMGPNAERVSVIGDFNYWQATHPLKQFHTGSGIWEGFIATLESGIRYKYHIRSKFNNIVWTRDPFAFWRETASDHQWYGTWIINGRPGLDGTTKRKKPVEPAFFYL